jgi:hypothetical protein
MNPSELDPAAFESEMESALGRLDGMFAHPSPPTAEGDVSFDVSEFSGLDESSPEGQLLTLLQEAETPQPAKTVSFSTEDEEPGALDKAKDEFEHFMERINRDILNFAHVETSGADSLVAATRVNWTGDALTVFSAGATPGDLREHAETLRRELMARNLRLRMFATVTTAAGKISLLITNPASALLSLPMAYQYVSQLSKQWQALQSLNQP